MINSKILLLTIGICSSIAGGFSQEVLSTSGDYFTTASYDIAFTIGECVIQTFNNADNILTQGFNQYYSEGEPSAITKVTGLNPDITVFPNPADNFVRLQVGDINSLSYLLYDMNGQLLENRNIENDITEISLQNRYSAGYLLKVLQKDRQIKSFIIIKK